MLWKNDEMNDCVDEHDSHDSHFTVITQTDTNPEDKPRAKSAMEWFDATIEKYRQKNPEKINDAFIAKQKAKLLRLL